MGARRSRRAAAAARHPRRVRPLGDRRPRRQRRPRNQRHHLRLLRLPRPNVQADVPSAGRAGRGQEGQAAPRGRRVRAGGRGPPPRAGPRRVGAADAHVPGGQRPGVPALGADRPRRHVPLRPRQGAGAAAGGRRRAHRRLRQRHAQPAPDPAQLRPDQPRAGAAVGGRVRRLAQGVPPRRQARRREALPGEGAVRGGGAPAARPLLPAARRARRRWGRVRGRARPPWLVQRHAIVRVLSLCHQKLIMIGVSRVLLSDCRLHLRTSKSPSSDRDKNTVHRCIVPHCRCQNCNPTTSLYTPKI
ncbi:hypothetical protein BDA96_03G406200 [Sorghum bicolor]|uniref:Uncharacterized protein n=1 Tax=Sorghum bicolor TaxID=4558 RepID=A0A921RHV2_SORBI|nr:hypothetical protein BDA96_03G406200 [Sorghum bicolor]